MRPKTKLMKLEQLMAHLEAFTCPTMPAAGNPQFLKILCGQARRHLRILQRRLKPKKMVSLPAATTYTVKRCGHCIRLVDNVCIIPKYAYKGPLACGGKRWMVQ